MTASRQPLTSSWRKALWPFRFDSSQSLCSAIVNIHVSLDIEITSSWCSVLFPSEMPLRRTCHLRFALLVQRRPWRAFGVSTDLTDTAFFLNYCIEFHTTDRPPLMKSLSYRRTWRLFSLFANTRALLEDARGRVSKGGTIVQSLWRGGAAITCQRLPPSSRPDAAGPVHTLSGVGDRSGVPHPSAR